MRGSGLATAGIGWQRSCRPPTSPGPTGLRPDGANGTGGDEDAGERGAGAAAEPRPRHNEENGPPSGDPGMTPKTLLPNHCMTKTVAMIVSLARVSQQAVLA